jgi:hypothetical protein
MSTVVHLTDAQTFSAIQSKELLHVDSLICPAICMVSTLSPSSRWKGVVEELKARAEEEKPKTESGPHKPVFKNISKWNGVTCEKLKELALETERITQD